MALVFELFDKIELLDGRKATIVDIYEQGVAYEADIETSEGYITDTIFQKDIKQKV